VTADHDDPADVVGDTLQDYASRGVFRGFSRGRARGAKTSYRLTWHYDRTFELVLDRKRRTLRFPSLLSDLPDGRALYGELLGFLRSRLSQELPEHRRIDGARAKVRSYRRAGNMSLTLEVKDGDYEYGTRRLIRLVQEIFLDFLREGAGHEYLVESFDLGPDALS
jgi:hypothetical protein